MTTATLVILIRFISRNVNLRDLVVVYYATSFLILAALQTFAGLAMDLLDRQQKSASS